MSQIASAQPASSRSISSGRAEVVRSRSLCRRPSIASRTGPPTRASSCPASANRGPELVDDRGDPVELGGDVALGVGQPDAPGRSAVCCVGHDGDSLAGCGRARSRPSRAGTSSRGVLRPPSLPHALAGRRPAVLPGHGALRPRAAAASPRAGRRAAGPATPGPARPDSAAGAPDALDHARLHPRPGPDRDHGARSPTTPTRTWTAINVHGFIGAHADHHHRPSSPAAARPRSTADVGHRITAPGTFDHHRLPAPGPDARPSRSGCPRSTLPVSTPGVYWFGVHALGANRAGRTGNAAGRDRTFLPLVPASRAGDRRHRGHRPGRSRCARRHPRPPTARIEDTDAWLSSLRTGRPPRRSSTSARPPQADR